MNDLTLLFITAGKVPKKWACKVYVYVKQLGNEMLKLWLQTSAYWTKVLCHVPQLLYARMEEDAQNEPDTTYEDDSEELRKNVSFTRKVGTEGLRVLFFSKITNASPRLLQAFSGYLALPPMSFNRT